ncbi:hypothetical protein F2Q69_00047481 [Brassica cretica]|uniref:Uncharacterized protein n=1 Tax=Brassica cretica TaxID=69181 RepID=A0A8S9PT26_BRACR|nr:hypothetical protein F2Q69_00047481 [Brassica cretica]
MDIASKGSRIVLRELRRRCTVSGQEVGPRPWARGEVTSVETVLAYDRDLIQTDPLLDIPWTSRKRSSKKKTSAQLSSGNPCTNEEIVPKEEFEVEQEEKEAYWDALCGSITPLPKVFYPTRPVTQLDPTLPSRTSPAYLKILREFTEFRAGLCFESRCMGRVRRIPRRDSSHATKLS